MRISIIDKLVFLCMPNYNDQADIEDVCSELVWCLYICKSHSGNCVEGRKDFARHVGCHKNVLLNISSVAVVCVVV